MSSLQLTLQCWTIEAIFMTATLFPIYFFEMTYIDNWDHSFWFMTLSTCWVGFYSGRLAQWWSDKETDRWHARKHPGLQERDDDERRD